MHRPGLRQVAVILTAHYIFEMEPNLVTNIT